jgi:hypothetical protein
VVSLTKLHSKVGSKPCRAWKGMTVSDKKHSSLLRHGINYGRKTCYDACPILTHVSSVIDLTVVLLEVVSETK